MRSVPSSLKGCRGRSPRRSRPGCPREGSWLRRAPCSAKQALLSYVTQSLSSVLIAGGDAKRWLLLRHILRAVGRLRHIRCSWVLRPGSCQLYCVLQERFTSCSELASAMWRFSIDGFIHTLILMLRSAFKPVSCLRRQHHQSVHLCRH